MGRLSWENLNLNYISMNYAFAFKPTSDKWGEYVNARFTGSNGVFEEWYQIKDGKLVSWTQAKRSLATAE